MKFFVVIFTLVVIGAISEGQSPVKPKTNQSAGKNAAASANGNAKPGASANVNAKPGASANVNAKPGASANVNAKPGTSANVNAKPGTSANGNAKAGAPANGNANSGVSANGNANSGVSANGNATATGSIDGSLGPAGSVNGSLTPGGSISGSLTPEVSINGSLTPEVSINGSLFPEFGINGSIIDAVPGINVDIVGGNVHLDGLLIFQGHISGDVNFDTPVPEIPEIGGVSYVLDVKRTLFSPAKNKVVYGPRTNEAAQTISYMLPITDETPYYIDGGLKYNGTYLLDIKQKDALSSCAQYDEGTWEYVTVLIINTALTPKPYGCPVFPGNYTVYSQLPPLKVTFPKEIGCGDYRYALNVDTKASPTAERQWSFQLIFKFTIPDDGTCVNPN